MKLKFGPVRILAAGSTVDKREVSESLIYEMAESYNQEKYNARINYEHFEYGSRFGSVLELKAERHKVGGENTLFLMAMLEPNAYMLNLVSQGQKLHTSCEIDRNFAGTGKAYLVGLALTDTPASLGTSELKFSSGETQTEVFSTNEQLEGFANPEPEKPSLFKKLFSKNNQKDESMSQEIKETLGELLKQNQKVVEEIQKLSQAKSEPEATEPEPKQPETTEPEMNLMAELTDKLTKFSETIEASNSAISELVTKLSNETNEPVRLLANGGTSEDPEEIL